MARRKSALGASMERSVIERARRLTPEARLSACVNLARIGAEIKRCAKRHREETRNAKP
jgi:hypothetical protein